jgi:hypothetical protein
MANANVLCLGIRTDAQSWSNGCVLKGFRIDTSIIKPNPTLDEVTSFFAADADWVFFAGHFLISLYNNKGTTIITFHHNQIEVIAPDARGMKQIVTLTRPRTLVLDPKVIFWGGCDILDDKRQIDALSCLFNNPLMLGFRGGTGPEMTKAMFGDGFIPNNLSFFPRIQDPNDLADVRNAWLETAKYGWAGGVLEGRFCAVDPDGTIWCLKDKKIVETK